jgi:4'-phosphopantetheinyl transferase
MNARSVLKVVDTMNQTSIQNKILLWCSFYEEINDESLLSALRGLLDEAERKQELRFHFAEDRRRYLVTRALVRTVLSKYVSIAPQAWVFRANGYGRPVIANEIDAGLSLSFNITHAQGLIILAIAWNCEIGVDTENTRRRVMALDLADRFFAPSEVSELYGLPPHRQHQRFLEYWTLKESYIKARGMGLSIPLSEFSFHFPKDEHVEIVTDLKQGDSSRFWQFTQLWIAQHYLTAVCIGRNPSTTPQLIVKKVVPLMYEESLEYRPFRASKC